MTWTLIFEHLFIVLAASICSIAVGLPLGIAAYLLPKLRSAILWIADLLQTIPSLALLGIIMVFAGPGKLTVIIGITLYSLLPIVRNTCLGLQQVDPGVKEAARGMGMSKAYRVLRVELPLAFPTVFTGIRIAVVNAIGSTVFAAFVGGGGLGSVINQGIRVRDVGKILSATGVLMLIAVVLDTLMGWFERQAKRTRTNNKVLWIPAVAMVLAFCLLLPYGSSKKEGLLMYDGDYSETRILCRLAKLLIEDKTDLQVTIQDQMTQVNNFKSLEGANHSCDLMISYDGTLLTTFFGQDITDIPAGMSLYEYVNQVANDDYDMHMLSKLGFDNTYAVAVPQTLADEYNLETVSDLVPIAGRLVFGAEQEFFTLEGSMKYGPFVEYYGLEFKDSVSVDMGLKYSAIENGSFQVTEVYATDGLNRKANLKILDDDLGFFPEYNGTFVIRNDAATRFAGEAPELEAVLNLLGGQISTEQMAQMTYEVDVLGKTADEVALTFLTDLGLLSGT